MDFSGEMDYRKGSEMDATRLRKTFSSLNYQVHVVENLNCEQMQVCIEKTYQHYKKAQQKNLG